MLRVYFDDFEISKYCDIISAFPVVSDIDGHIEMKIEIAMVDNVMKNLDMLNRILHTREPKKLVISDYPERYLMCKLTGGIKPSSRFFMAQMTLTFVSEHNYWSSSLGEINVDADKNGKFEINNRGTAPTIPRFEIDFESESGFLGIVAPNGFIALGDKEQQDRIELPQMQVAMNEEMHEADMSDWTKLSSDSHAKGLWVPDYNKLSLTTGKPAFDQWGIRLTKSASPKSGHYWNCYAYTKDLAKLPEVHQLTNFKLQSRVTMLDQSGTTKNTGMYLIVLMDVNNKPIVTTSIYNVDANSNTVTITAKRNNFSGGANNSSEIIHTATFPNGFNGSIQMIREHSVFTWIFDSGRDQTVYKTGSQVEKFNIGSIAYIKSSARYGYAHDGTRHSIRDFTRGRANKVTNVRTWKGKKQYLISNSGLAIYWMNEEDLTANASGVGSTVKQSVQRNQQTSKFSVEDGELAKLTPTKVLIVGGTWDNTSPFTGANLTSCVVHRLNSGSKFKEVTNTFQPGDKLIVDNNTGEILLNGLTFQGLHDVDSRFFDIDYGLNDIQLKTSEWATMPKAKITFNERFR